MEGRAPSRLKNLGRHSARPSLYVSHENFLIVDLALDACRAFDLRAGKLSGEARLERAAIVAVNLQRHSRASRIVDARRENLGTGGQGAARGWLRGHREFRQVRRS